MLIPLIYMKVRKEREKATERWRNDLRIGNWSPIVVFFTCSLCFFSFYPSPSRPQPLLSSKKTQAVFEANYSRKLSSLKHRLVVMPASMRSGGGGGGGNGGGAAGGGAHNGNASAENSVGGTAGGGGGNNSGDNDEENATAAAAAAATATQQPQQQRSVGPTPSPAPPPLPRVPHLLAFPSCGGGGGGDSAGNGYLHNNNGSSGSLRAPSVLYWSSAFEAPHNVKIVVRRQLGDDRAPKGEFEIEKKQIYSLLGSRNAKKNFENEKKKTHFSSRDPPPPLSKPVFPLRAPAPRAPPDRLQRDGGAGGPQINKALRDARASHGVVDLLAAAALRLLCDRRRRCRRRGRRGFRGSRSEGGVCRRRRRSWRPADAGPGRALRRAGRGRGDGGGNVAGSGTFLGRRRRCWRPLLLPSGPA